mmetsp:Transcript_11480/g.29062  ORF Transcript_11480/g.29062 Transcript_11480/m.29062 type:complete len:476 (-) Transcript_11480:33-1460(-)
MQHQAGRTGDGAPRRDAGGDNVPGRPRQRSRLFQTMPKNTKWWYRDTQNKPQGGFETRQIMSWCQSMHFKDPAQPLMAETPDGKHGLWYTFEHYGYLPLDNPPPVPRGARGAGVPPVRGPRERSRSPPPHGGDRDYGWHSNGPYGASRGGGPGYHKQSNPPREYHGRDRGRDRGDLDHDRNDRRGHPSDRYYHDSWRNSSGGGDRRHTQQQQQHFVGGADARATTPGASPAITTPPAQPPPPAGHIRAEQVPATGESGRVLRKVESLCEHLGISGKTMQASEIMTKLVSDHPGFPGIQYYDSGDEGTPPTPATYVNPIHRLMDMGTHRGGSAATASTAKMDPNAKRRVTPTQPPSSAHPAGAAATKTSPAKEKNKDILLMPEVKNPFKALLEEPLPRPEGFEKGAPHDPRPWVARKKKKLADALKWMEEDEDALDGGTEDAAKQDAASRASPDRSFLSELTMPDFWKDGFTPVRM